MVNIKFVILVSLFVTALFHVKAQDINYSDATPSVHQDSLACNTAAKFPGGYGEMLKFIQKNMVYPDSIDFIAPGCSKILVQFTVNREGNLSNFQLIKGDLEELFETYVAAFKKMGNWIPAKRNCEDVESTVVIPFRVRID